MRKIYALAALALGILMSLALVRPAQATDTSASPTPSESASASVSPTVTASPTITETPQCGIEPWICNPSWTPSPRPSLTTPPATYGPGLPGTPRPRRSPAATLAQTPMAGGHLPYLIGGAVVLVVAGSILAFASRTRRVRPES